MHLISHFTFIVFYHTHFDHKFLLADSVSANGCTSEKASPKDLFSPTFISQDGFLSRSASSVTVLPALPPRQPPPFSSLCLEDVKACPVHHGWISHLEHKGLTLPLKGQKIIHMKTISIVPLGCSSLDQVGSPTRDSPHWEACYGVKGREVGWLLHLQQILFIFTVWTSELCWMEQRNQLRNQLFWNYWHLIALLQLAHKMIFLIGKHLIFPT